MNDSDLDALFARARGRRPDTSKTEYALETRVLARLRSQRSGREDRGSVWAMVSWRMVPFFATCVLALAIWQAKLVSMTDEAAAFDSVEHPENADLLNSLN